MTHALHGAPYAALLDRLEPFLVATPYNLPHLETAPLGVTIAPERIYDPLHVSSELFCDLLQLMDARTFGPGGMPMSRWVFYDGSELPGGIFGFGVESDAVPEPVRESYGLPPDVRGLVPFSMYIAIPTPEAGTWFGHNLSSLNRALPEMKLRGLGTLTKALGLAAFRARTQVGATQWSSRALFIHSRFGPLELETAYTPAHSTSETLTYVLDCTHDSLLGAVGVPGISVPRPAPERWVRSDDSQAMIDLQRELEAGARLCIPDVPRALAGDVLETPIATLA